MRNKFVCLFLLFFTPFIFNPTLEKKPDFSFLNGIRPIYQQEEIDKLKSDIIKLQSQLILLKVEQDSEKYRSIINEEKIRATISSQMMLEKIRLDSSLMESYLIIKSDIERELLFSKLFPGYKPKINPYLYLLYWPYFPPHLR